jgi:short-subunit dehydrogenase
MGLERDLADFRAEFERTARRSRPRRRATVRKGGAIMYLEGKRVIITGGSSGIGLATAQAMTAVGAKVFITGRRPDIVAKAVDQLRATHAEASGVAADVATNDGRARTLGAGLEKLGSLDILVNNAGGVRAGRLEDTSEAEIRAMIEVDLVAPILLTRAALPHLRASGDGLVVNVTSGIALIGLPFYATYAAAKAGFARFSEALRRELKGEGVHVLTVYPGGTDTPMMKSNRAGPELGFGREPASAVAEAIVAGIRADAFEVVRGGEARDKMIALNRDDPAAIDQRFLGIKPALAEAVRDHSAL